MGTAVCALQWGGWHHYPEEWPALPTQVLAGRSVKTPHSQPSQETEKSPYGSNQWLLAAVKTVGTQGHLETLLYPCLHSKMTKWLCTSFQSGEPSLDPVYMKRSQDPGLYRPKIIAPPWPAPTQNAFFLSKDSTGS